MQIKVKLTRQENAGYFGVPVGAVVEMDMEDYLLGVVPAEVGNAPLECCKAQAVAARTYALPYARKGDAISDASSVAQAYRAPRGVDSAYATAHRGVTDTVGEVLYHDGKLITTCSYSASNGGRTTSSEERWGGYRAYLIAQEDPWDLAVTGGVKTGHGVGMSQAGASYAADALGMGYREILGFYYPGTEIWAAHGDAPSQPKGGSGMSNGKTNTGLVEWVKKWLGEAYWYGCCCYQCTSA